MSQYFIFLNFFHLLKHQTLLADIRHGQPYSQQSCGHLAQILETQDEDTEDDIGGEEIGGDSLGDVFFVPEDLDNYNVLRNSPDIAIIDDDLEHDQQEEAWTRLNHVSTFHLVNSYATSFSQKRYSNIFKYEK